MLLNSVQQLGDSLGKGAFGQVYRTYLSFVLRLPRVSMVVLLKCRCLELGYGRDGRSERDPVEQHTQG